MELRSGGDAFDWYFLAMAHKQLGNQEEARQWYQKAVAWTQTNKPDDVELRRFQAEAAALLGVTLPAVEPAPEPAGKVQEAKESSKSTPAPEAAKVDETEELPKSTPATGGSESREAIEVRQDPGPAAPAGFQPAPCLPPASSRWSASHAVRGLAGFSRTCSRAFRHQALATGTEA